MNSKNGNKKRCFVTMGFGIKTDYATGRKLDLNKTYRLLIKPVVEGLGIECIRADEITHTGSIDLPIYSELASADLVIADLSTGNANALYELGLRHALRPRTTIVITERHMIYPFDFNHIKLLMYDHMGDSIDYDEVARFRMLLANEIKSRLSDDITDSPIYTYLNLTPPTTSSADFAASATKDESKTDPTGQNVTLSAIVEQAEEAIKLSQFSGAKVLFKSALALSVSGDRAAEDPYLVRRLAYCTYKAKEPTEKEALKEASNLLNNLDPKHTNDAETLGLMGRIEKRLYLIKEGEVHLINAIKFHQRVYILLNDRYYAINLAFLLNARASSSYSSTDQEKIADMIFANRIRQEVLKLCDEQLLEIESRQKRESEQPLAIEQKETENETRFWILLNKAEAYFGIGDFDEYSKAKESADELIHDPNMKIGFEHQVEKLRKFLKQSGHLLNPVWTDENSEIEPGNYEKLYQGALVELSRGNFQKALKYINQAIEIDDEMIISNPAHFLHPEFYESKVRILNALGDTSGIKAALDRHEEISEQNKFRINLSKKILVEKLVIENHPFFGSFTWLFTPGVNILLGRNGYGKSHLLRFITAFLTNDKQKMRDWISPNAPINVRAKIYIASDHPVNTAEINSLTIQINDLVNAKSMQDSGRRLTELQEKLDAEERRLLVNKEGITSNIGKIPILAIPDSRFIDRSQTTVNNASAIEDLRKDGATDFLYSNPFGPIISKGLFITAQQNSTDFTKEPYSLIQRVISELANEHNTNSNNKGSSNGSAFFTFTRIESTSTTGDYKIYVRSSDNNDEVLLNNVSQGTFSIVSICLMIYRFLKELYPHSQNILLEPAIVIVDEIDAHLHPSWEQKIVGILRREFPGVQFIITAHSPLIVAGCLEREVAVIRNNEKGFNLEQNSENFIGLSTPTLLQKVFEIEDKDEQYLLYSSLSGSEKEIELQIKLLEALKKTNQISQDQSKRLNELYNTLRYIDKVKEVQQNEASNSALETQNMLLKKEIEFLKNQASAAR